MQVLVFNGGSSSLTYKIFEVQKSHALKEVFRGKAYRVGVQGTKQSYIESIFNGKIIKEVLPLPDHGTAAALAIERIKKYNFSVDYIGHRFVHGGTYFKKTTLVNARTFQKLKECLPLAPLHNPISLEVIRQSMRLYPKEVPQFVVVDSAFHSSLPKQAYYYALPDEIIKKYHFRKYGFHGLSYSSIALEVPRILHRKSNQTNLIVCHLGTGGASIAAIQKGCSLDTSMGFSPQSGLIMSTRAGDLDLSVIQYLIEEQGYSPEALIKELNKNSGLLGLSGFSSDINDIIEKMSDEQKGKRAQLAFQLYTHRLKKYLGAYIVLLQGAIDALVFTDDVGVGCPAVREEICRGMQWAGIQLDRNKNHNVNRSQSELISKASSKIKILCVPTQEEAIICREGLQMIGGQK